MKAAVNWALETGYRHIDTAHLYRNEAAIGEILHEWITNDRVKREELFVVTKVQQAFSVNFQCSHNLFSCCVAATVCPQTWNGRAVSQKLIG